MKARIKQPILSIVTVCLNEPQLERTCESISNQTFQNFEWIVIDGGSSARTMAVFYKYKDNISYLISEKDKGVYYAMNKGIAQSRGLWINFMNAGDGFYRSDTLENISHELGYRVEEDVLYGDYIWGYPSYCKEVYMPNELSISYFLKQGICHQAAFIKRNIFSTYGDYDTSLEILSDYKLFLTLFKHKAVFSKLDATVATVAERGLSANREKVEKERDAIIRNLYSDEELAYLKREPSGRLRSIASNLRCKFLSHNG